MKRVLSSLLLVLALVPLLLLLRWNDVAKSPWSLPVDHVRTRLTAPRFLWKDGESPTISLCARASETRALEAGHSIELVVQHGSNVVARFGPASVPDTPLTIAGGERVEIVLPFSPVLNDGPGLYTVFGRVGPWQLRPLKIRVVGARSAER